MLMMQLPAQWHDGAVYLANQTMIAQMITWSTADGRPLFASMIENRPALRLFGWPLIPTSQLPNVRIESDQGNRARLDRRVIHWSQGDRPLSWSIHTRMAIAPAPNSTRE